MTRSKLQAGTLAGLQVADAQAASVPGLTTNPVPGTDGTPVPLTGTATFVPNPGKSYVLLAELRGTPGDADGAGLDSCFASVRIYVNSEPLTSVSISADTAVKPPFDVNPVDAASSAVGLLTPGQPQTIAANAFGGTGCGGTTAGLRISVVELG